MPKGKPKAAEAPKTVPHAAKPEPAESKPANKMEGVRRALSKLGHEAKPPQIQGWLKDTYKLTMPVSTISNYKSTILSKTGGKKKAKSHKGGRPPKTAATPHPSTGGAISLDDIRAVKHLADRIGAEKVRELALVLAK